MKQTEIGLIPDDWEVKSLEEVTFNIGDGIHTTPIYSDSGNFFFINGNNIKNGKIIFFEETKRVSENNAQKYIFPISDKTVLMSINGTIGNVAFYNKENIVLGKSAAYLTANNKLSKFYLFYILQSDLIKKQFNNILTGTTIQNLGLSTIRATLLPVPSLPEQQRIAKALSDADALISTTEKLLQKKKNIKQSAMQELLTGKKRLPGLAKSTRTKMTELGLIPEDWEVKKLSEFGTFSKGSGISREELNTGEYPAVRYGELYTTHNDYIKSFYSHISYEVASKSKKINKGDLLFTCSGETKEDIGKCVAFIGNEKAYAGGDLLILSPTVNIDSLFYGFLLNTTVAVKQKSSMAQGDAVVHISAESIGKIRVPFPSKKEQTAIANVLSSMDKEIETLNTKLEKYRNLKTAMMQQLLTGKIRL